MSRFTAQGVEYRNKLYQDCSVAVNHVHPTLLRLPGGRGGDASRDCGQALRSRAVLQHGNALGTRVTTP